MTTPQILLAFQRAKVAALRARLAKVIEAAIAIPSTDNLAEVTKAIDRVSSAESELFALECAHLAPEQTGGFHDRKATL